MTQALVPASHETVCGKCGGRLSCAECVDLDMLELARVTVRKILKGGERNAFAQLKAAELVLEKNYLEHLTDEDLLAEVRRRAART